MSSLLLADIVQTSEAVAATSSRKAKTEALAELFARAHPDEAPLAVAYLAGEPPQGRIGVGWATLSDLDVTHAGTPSLTVAHLDATIDRVATTSGAGSTAAREGALRELFRQATPPEADFVRRLLLGELRQGANEGLVVEGVAKAAGVPAGAVRRALMLSGDLGFTARAVLRGGRDALAGIGLEVLRPLRPMLASTAPGLDAALDAIGRASVEWKLDGARVQVHRHRDVVRVWTRNLNDVTERLPTVVDAVGALDLETAVLDGEVIGYAPDDRPQAFQDTMSRFGRESESSLDLVPFFFDLLHLDGRDLIDEPLATRVAQLELVAGELRVPGAITGDPAEAARVLDAALERGHEGVLVKAADSRYEAGRRGKAWRKVKPVHTLDLVVIAVEWGHGRRRGYLSNLHLGARDPDGGFVMVGKTFKGMTDEMLAWQTERFLELETHRQGHVVHVRPEQVVEIALDGVQASSRYPGGVALRFARVRGYRPDRDPATADTIATVRAMLG